MFAKLKAALAAGIAKAKAYALARWPEKSTLVGLGASLGTSTATIAALNLPRVATETVAAVVVVVGLLAAVTPTTKNGPIAKPAAPIASPSPAADA